MSDARALRVLSELERAKASSLRELLARAEALLADAEALLRSLHARHDADVAARVGPPDRGDVGAMARWARIDDARRDALRERTAAITSAQARADAARRARDEAAQTLAAHLARATAFERLTAAEPSDDD